MHHTHRRLRAGLLAPSLVIGIWGCGGAPASTSSQSQATVKGTVSVNGKPAGAGTVVFDGANPARPSLGQVRAEIGKDGTYEAKVYVGTNRVSLAGKDLIKLDPVIQYERINFEVQGGENTLAIDVPRKK